MGLALKRLHTGYRSAHYDVRHVFKIELTDINQALHLIEHSLAQDWPKIGNCGALSPVSMADEMFADD